MSRHRALLRWLVLTTAMLIAFACGEETTAPPTPTPPPFEGTRGPVEVEGTALVPPGALLVKVRPQLQGGFDRIIFEFANGLPGYRIEYVEPPVVHESSGEPVEIAGDAYLRVRFRVAAAHDPDTGERTYGGPLEITLDQSSLLEAEETGDFEGDLTWVLGLSREVDFQVHALEEPFRVVVDMAQP